MLKLVLIALLACLPIGEALAEGGSPKQLTAKGDSCVEPVEIMRRDHMDMLMHQRDETMIRGVRTEKYSLVGCISCHTQQDDSGQHIPVNAEGQFCEGCHTYAAVKLDCFQCHRTTPDVQVSAHE